jgi:hypothetical protein
VTVFHSLMVPATRPCLFALPVEPNPSPCPPGITPDAGSRD